MPASTQNVPEKNHTITARDVEMVLVGSEPAQSGYEQIVLAFRQGEDLYIPVDADRAANDRLLQADQLYIWRTDEFDEYAMYDVTSRTHLAPADRRRLEDMVGKPLSDGTDVLHLVGAHAAVGVLHREPAGFVAVIDGSERALRALAPALAIADAYGRSLRVCSVVADENDKDTLHAVQLQLADSTIDAQDVVAVAKADLEGKLFDWMRQGHILVASAFGVWAADGRLYGMVNGLVKHNAPAIIGVGPKVPADWKPSIDRPVVVFVDSSEHAHDVVDRLDTFLDPPRGPLMVVHVTTEDPPDRSVADEVAAEIFSRFGLPVQAKCVDGLSAAEAIGTVASALDAQLAIVTSWHRPQTGAQRVVSTSVSSVAHAPCPVVILSAP